ncbi:MAG: endonuclease/exonuclease/phosphatase family protein [Mycobacteriales bacterium]
MVRTRRLLLTFLCGLLLVGTAGAARADAASHRQRHLTVATYNLYLGANLTPIYQSTTQAQMVQRAGEAFAHVKQVDFPSRAEAIAKLIARHPAEVLGLQEVAKWESGPIGGDLTTTVDYLPVLLTALARHGQFYYPASVSTNFSGTMPISATEQAKFTDHDVILVRWWPAGPRLRAHAAGDYDAKLVIPSPTGVTFTVPRGWTTADVTVRGRTVRIAETHLEAYSKPIRDSQAAELRARLAGSPYPVVLAGDVNSPPTDTTGPYGQLIGDGYADGWVTVHGPDGGFTAGQTDDLDNVPSRIDHRIDYVFTRGTAAVPVAADQATVIGDQLADRTPGGLWPSDHAGVVVRVRIGR